ncbi:MAG: hypothetical protein FJX35_04030 [Alphaproteobacteria bacterium]|nr:hypothetical protein [Alphaproteobacteria bacterium]
MDDGPRPDAARIIGPHPTGPVPIGVDAEREMAIIAVRIGFFDHTEPVRLAPWVQGLIDHDPRAAKVFRQRQDGLFCDLGQLLEPHIARIVQAADGRVTEEDKIAIDRRGEAFVSDSSILTFTRDAILVATELGELSVEQIEIAVRIRYFVTRSQRQ